MAKVLCVRRRSNLAQLALATRLGEKRREHRLHRPRLAFRAGGAPLAVLADRLLEAEALPAPGAAVLVDRHRRRKVIPARTWRSSRPSQKPPVDTSERTCPSTMRECFKSEASMPRKSPTVIRLPPEAAISGGKASAASLAVCRPVRHPTNCSPRVT